jgi:hypothetical protein
MDLYKRMGKELRSLFHDLFPPKRAEVIRGKMEQIVAMAAQIGGSLHDEAKQLNTDVENYLKQPHDQQCKANVQRHAMRLEQETREI